MDHLRQVEDELKALGVEARKKYPEVKDATERALASLKIMRDNYVAEMMKDKTKSVKLKPSSDVVAPYILILNYSDASSKAVTMAFNGIHLLLNYNIVCPTDVKNVLRVMNIQLGRSEVHLKILQILVQLLNLIESERNNSETVTISEQTLSNLLGISLQLCESRGSVSVGSTALATSRQIIMFVIRQCERDNNRYLRQLNASRTPSESPELTSIPIGSAPLTTPAQCVYNLLSDLCFFVLNRPGEWLKGVQLPVQVSLDFLYEIISENAQVIRLYSQYHYFMQTRVICTVRALLRNVTEDFVLTTTKYGLASAAAYASRTIRLARSLFLQHWDAQFVSEYDILLTLLVHTLQPNDHAMTNFSTSIDFTGHGLRAGAGSGGSGLMNASAMAGRQSGSGGSSGIEDTIRAKFDEATALISRLNIPLLPTSTSVNKSSTSSSSSSSMGMTGVVPGGESRGVAGTSGLVPSSTSASASSALKSGPLSLPGCVLTLVNIGPTLSGNGGNTTPGSAGSNGGNTIMSINGSGHHATQLLAHPAGCALEALLSLLLSDRFTHCYVNNASNNNNNVSNSAEFKCLSNLLVNVIVSVSSILTGAMGVESNRREFDEIMRTSQLTTAIEGVLLGVEEPHYDSMLRFLNDFLLSKPNGISSQEVIGLAFELMQICIRLLFKMAIQESMKHSEDCKRQKLPLQQSLLLPYELLSKMKTLSIQNLTMNDGSKELLKNVIENVHEVVQSSCIQLVESCESNTVIQRSLGMLAETTVIAGVLDLHYPGNTMLGALCKLAVPQWHGLEMLPLPSSSNMPSNTSTSGNNNNNNNNTNNGNNNTTNNMNVINNNRIRWKHQVALERVFQVLHVMGDAVMDWDLPIDAFEQIVAGLQEPLPRGIGMDGSTGNSGNSGSESLQTQPPVDVEAVLDAMDRFKKFSVFLNDESLVKLMTSLVSLSMNALGMNLLTSLNNVNSNNNNNNNSNNIANNSNNSSNGSVVVNATIAISNPNPLPKRNVRTLFPSDYLMEAINNGHIGFALQSVIEITKLNAFRIDCIWQMITSHLRVLATQKSPKLRIFSVVASYDLMTYVLTYMENNKDQSAVNEGDWDANGTNGTSNNNNNISSNSSSDASSPMLAIRDSASLLTDEIIFFSMLPTMDRVFTIDDSTLNAMIYAKSSSRYYSKRSKLTKREVLYSLKIMISIRYEDVRNEVLNELETLLQNGSPCFQAGAWGTITEVLSTIPESIVEMSAMSNIDEEWYNSKIDNNNNNNNSSSNNTNNGGGPLTRQNSPPPPTSTLSSSDPSPQWSKTSLNNAFNCLKLIVDEYLDLLDLDDVNRMIKCLHTFALQNMEINISLTSLEMIWKVADVTITKYYLQWKKKEMSRGEAINSLNNILLNYNSNINNDNYLVLLNCIENELQEVDNSTDTNTKSSNNNNNNTVSTNAVISSIIKTDLDAIDFVLLVTMDKLQRISMDFRPEIRHCALSTLFGAISANANRLSHGRWHYIFNNIFFSLLQKIFQRSLAVQERNEVAVAPELKKGVRMTMHHSRDTAKKQWNESQVLMLRGINKILKPATRILLVQPWFEQVWKDAIRHSRGVFQTSRAHDKEVSIAGLDVLFGMIKYVCANSDDETSRAITNALTAGNGSTGTGSGVPSNKGNVVASNSSNVNNMSSNNNNISNNNNATTSTAAAALMQELNNREKHRERLWRYSWKIICESALFDQFSLEINHHFVSSLNSFYNARIDSEFRYSDNVRSLLTVIVALARIHIFQVSDDINTTTNNSNKGGSTSPSATIVTDTSTLYSRWLTQLKKMSDRTCRVSLSQTHRLIMDLVQKILGFSMAHEGDAVLPSGGSGGSGNSKAYCEGPMAMETLALLATGGDNLVVSMRLLDTNGDSQVSVLGPSISKLREEARSMLLQLMNTGDMADLHRVLKVVNHRCFQTAADFRVKIAEDYSNNRMMATSDEKAELPLQQEDSFMICDYFVKDNLSCDGSRSEPRSLNYTTVRDNQNNANSNSNSNNNTSNSSNNSGSNYSLLTTIRSILLPGNNNTNANSDNNNISNTNTNTNANTTDNFSLLFSDEFTIQSVFPLNEDSSLQSFHRRYRVFQEGIELSILQAAVLQLLATLDTLSSSTSSSSSSSSGKVGGSISTTPDSSMQGVSLVWARVMQALLCFASPWFEGEMSQFANHALSESTANTTTNTTSLTGTSVSMSDFSASIDSMFRKLLERAKTGLARSSDRYYLDIFRCLHLSSSLSLQSLVANTLQCTPAMSTEDLIAYLSYVQTISMLFLSEASEVLTNSFWSNMKVTMVVSESLLFAVLHAVVETCEVVSSVIVAINNASNTSMANRDVSMNDKIDRVNQFLNDFGLRVVRLLINTRHPSSFAFANRFAQLYSNNSNSFGYEHNNRLIQTLSQWNAYFMQQGDVETDASSDRNGGVDVDVEGDDESSSNQQHNHHSDSAVKRSRSGSAGSASSIHVNTSLANQMSPFQGTPQIPASSSSSMPSLLSGSQPMSPTNRSSMDTPNTINNIINNSSNGNDTVNAAGQGIMTQSHIVVCYSAFYKLSFHIASLPVYSGLHQTVFAALNQFNSRDFLQVISNINTELEAEKRTSNELRREVRQLKSAASLPF